MNSFTNQSESLFFSAILNHLLTLERNPRKERGVFSSEGKERKSRNVSSQVSSIPQKEKNSRFRGKERKENRGAAKPITRNQGIITVASERHKSDTNRVSRFNASSPLWRVIHPPPPSFLLVAKKRDEEKKKNGGKASVLSPRRILFLGVGGSRLINLNSRETFRGTGGNNYINGVGRKPPLDTSVDAHPFSWRLALPRGSLSPLLTPAPVSIAKHGTDRNNAPPTG